MTRAAFRRFLLEPSTNPAIHDQAVSRVHRIGQTQPCTVFRFVIADSVEETIMEHQEERWGLYHDLDRLERRTIQSSRTCGSSKGHNLGSLVAVQAPYLSLKRVLCVLALCLQSGTRAERQSGRSP